MKVLIILLFITGIGIAGFFIWRAYSTSPIALAPQPQLPLAVQKTRSELFRITTTRRYESLRPLTGIEFQYDRERAYLDDALSYWKSMRYMPIKQLPVLLNQEYAVVDGIYIWPSVFIKNADDWTESDLRILRNIASDEEIASYQSFGFYAGYRVGIREDGTWLYFLSGE